MALNLSNLHMLAAQLWQAFQQHQATPANQPQQSPDPFTVKMGSEAQSRFTHTPLHLRQVDGGPDAYQGADSVTGATLSLPGRPQNDINIFSQPNATLTDLQKVMHHEDIHSALSPIQKLDPYIPGGPIGYKAIDTFHDANRAGDTMNELPAYMGSFEPSLMRGMNQQQADQWNEQFLQRLPPTTGELLRRIIQSAKSVPASSPSK